MSSSFVKAPLFIVILFLVATAALPALEPTPLPSAKWKETGAGLWRELELPFTPAVSAVGMVDGTLYICTHDQGILIARDQGKSWSQALFGKVAFESFESSGTTVRAGARGGIAYSADAGKSWATKAFLKDKSITGIAASSGRLIIGTPEGIFISDNGGTTVEKAPGSPPGEMYSLFSSSGGLWVVSFERDKDTAELYSSSDNGSTWAHRAGLPMKKDGAEARVTPYDISASGAAVGITSQLNLFYTIDGGNSWKTIDNEDQPTEIFTLGSGEFVFTDPFNNVHYIKAGDTSRKTIPDRFPGAKAVWEYLSQSIDSFVPEGAALPDADWSPGEVGALINAPKMIDPQLVPLRFSREEKITRLCSDGKIVYAATAAGRIFRYPLYVLLGNSPAIPEDEQVLSKKIADTFQKQDVAACESAIAELARKNDWNPYVFYFRGYLSATQKKFKEAISDFSQLLILEPRSTDGYFYRGLSYQALGRHLRAVSDFSSVITLKSPRAPFALANRGVSYLGLRDKGKARTDLEAAVKAGVKEAQQYIDTYLK